MLDRTAADAVPIYRDGTQPQFAGICVYENGRERRQRREPEIAKGGCNRLGATASRSVAVRFPA